LFKKSKRLLLPIILGAFVFLSPPGLSLAAGETAKDQGAKIHLQSKFVEQMQSPSRHINIGLAYWIELNRQGRLYRTSHLASFQSGDQIRFHILPNADAYAYIVLRQGSQGTKCVLFPPDSPNGSSGDNLLRCGADCVVPQQGSLEFDQVPGTERVGLLLSRSKIDPDSYLTKTAAQQQTAPEISSSNRAEPLSDLEKSFDAVFAGASKAQANAQVSAQANAIEARNSGALEVLAAEGGVAKKEEAQVVLASPSTAIVVNEDPESVVSVDFLLQHN